LSRETLGLLIGFVGVCIFAGTLPFTRIAVQELDPWFVTAGRASLSGLVAGSALILLRKRSPDRTALKKLALISLCVVGIFPAFTALAMKSVPASHGGVVLGVLPLATAAISVWLNGERPGPGFWLSALAGTGLVVAFALHEGGGAFALADVLLIGAVLSAAVGYNISGQLALSFSGWEVISWVLVVALPISLPATLLVAPQEPGLVGRESWIAFGYVTLFSQYLGFFAWNAGLALGGVARVSQVQLLQTFVTLMIAAVLNGEKVDLITWAGAAAIVALVLASRRAAIRRVPAKPRAPAPS
jgi:drug/metabolite transporter (DMT)-like permease